MRMMAKTIVAAVALATAQLAAAKTMTAADASGAALSSPAAAPVIVAQAMASASDGDPGSDATGSADSYVRTDTLVDPITATLVLTSVASEAQAVPGAAAATVAISGLSEAIGLDTLIALGFAADGITSTSLVGIDADGKLYALGNAAFTNLVFGSDFAALSALNLVIPDQVDANTVLIDDPSLRLVLNEQITDAGDGMLAIATNAIHLSFMDFAIGDGSYTGDIVIGHSGASIAATLAEGGTPTVPVEASTVPEPAGWAMMISGFGAVGLAMRRRPSVRRAAVAA